MNLESNLLQMQTECPRPLHWNGKWSREAALKDAEQGCVQRFKGEKTVKNKSDTFLTASQKRKDKKLILTQVAYEIQLQPKAICFIKSSN